MEHAGFTFVATNHHDTYPAISPLQADLAGKVVAVTGASRGIGRATAISYAKAGASGIVVLARSDLSSLETELLDAAKKAGRKSELKVLALSGVDTTDRVAVDKAAERVAATFGGKVDILINNAGYLEEPKPIDKSDPDEWWKTWEVNVKGVYLTSRAFIPLLLKSELKTIVMVSSVGAHLTRGGMSAYQISKSAVLRLDSFLMEEYGTQGLLVYGIHPGGVLTELASKMDKSVHANLTDTPELAGDSLVWLTKERREWLADRYISVNWDVDELQAKKDAIVQGELLKVRMRV